MAFLGCLWTGPRGRARPPAATRAAATGLRSRSGHAHGRGCGPNVAGRIGGPDPPPVEAGPYATPRGVAEVPPDFVGPRCQCAPADQPSDDETCLIGDRD